MNESENKAIKAAGRIFEYMDLAREHKLFQKVDDGYLVKFDDEFISDMREWTDVVRGDKRLEYDRINNDSGDHRIDEGIIGKMAECACYIAGPSISLEKSTGRFSVDLDIYERMECYDCDLNDSVTVKTSGRWSEKTLGHTGWIANQGDPVRCDPEGKYIILCKYVSDSEILIMGWVKASDLCGKWNDCVSLDTKKCVYFKTGHFTYGSRKIHVWGGGAEEVMVPISGELDESCDNKRHTQQS
jgi:hypothetical protein